MLSYRWIFAVVFVSFLFTGNVFALNSCHTWAEQTGATPQTPSCLSICTTASTGLGYSHCPDYCPEYCASDPVVDEADLGEPDCGIGNPCNAATGNKYQSETDYTSATSLPSFIRTYNSQFKQDIGFGVGWTTSTSAHIEINAKDATTGSIKITYRHADGKGEKFTCEMSPVDPVTIQTPSIESSGNNKLFGVLATTGVVPPTNLPNPLCRPIRATKTRIKVTESTFLLSMGYAGPFYTFDHTGHILEKHDRDGNASKYTYNTLGQLETVSNSFGHNLSFSYDAQGHLASFVDPASEVTYYQYDANDNLTKVTYPDASSKQYLYNHLSLLHALTGIIDENGNRYATFDYDNAGRATLTEHAGGQQRFTLAYTGNSTTVTNAKGDQEVFSFIKINGKNKISSRKQVLDGKGWSYLYNTKKKLEQRIDPEGRITKYTYSDTHGKLISVTDAFGTTEQISTSIDYFSYNYNNNNFLASDNTDFHEEYLNNKELAIIEFNTALECLKTFNFSCAMTHASAILPFIISATVPPPPPPTDLPSRISRKSIIEPQTVNYVNNKAKVKVAGAIENFPNSSQLLAFTASPPYIDTTKHHSINIDYNTNYKPSQLSETGYQPDGTPVARHWKISYMSDGRLRSVWDQETGGISTLNYHSCTTGGKCGQVSTSQNQTGAYTTYSAYDEHGRVLSLRDNWGINQYFYYDLRGRLTSHTRYDYLNALTTHFEYDPAGQLIKVTYPNTLSYSYTYDAAHQLREISNNLGHRITYEYDVMGDVIAQNSYDADQSLIRQFGIAYDLRRNITMVNSGPSISQRVNDTLGNLTQFTDPNQNLSSQLSFDNLNRLTLITNPQGNNTRFSYDINDRVTQVVAPGGATTNYVYDDLGNLLSEDSPDSGLTTYSHDLSGKKITQTDARGIASVMSYDKAKRITAIDYPGLEEDVTYRYGGCGYGSARFCSVVDESGKTTFNYDRHGNITSLENDLGFSHQTVFSYNKFDQLEKIELLKHLYGKNQTISYQRDLLGQITQVSATVNGVSTILASNIQYRGDGLLTNLNFGNGLTLQQSFDTQGQVVQGDLSGITNQSHSYDANGNLLQRQELNEPATYTYDELDQLLSEANTFNNSYSYDAIGNRLSDGAQNYSYAIGSNRLTTVGASTLSYDVMGNLTRDAQGKQYVYNQAGRLKEVYQGSTLLAQYKYNAFGQRIHKLTPNGDTRYWYDLQGNLLLETTPQGELLRYYVWLNNTPIAKIEHTANGDVLTYLHTDHLNTPRWGTDSAGSVVWRWSSDAFGNTAAQSDPDGDGINTTINLRFPGQYYDAETGLHYNHHRYYAPQYGRYITSDPIGLEGGLNTYAYVGANPNKWSDPSGLCPWCFIGYGLAIYNAYDIASGIINVVGAFANECSTRGERIGAVFFLALNVIDVTPGNMGRKVIVIGENMKRVQRYADEIGGHAYRPWKNDPFDYDLGMYRNKRWIQEMKRQGREIIDIGPDFQRRSLGRDPSDFYNMERSQLKNYNNYRKVFERSGKNSGGVPGLDY